MFLEQKVHGSVDLILISCLYSHFIIIFFNCWRTADCRTWVSILTKNDLQCLQTYQLSDLLNDSHIFCSVVISHSHISSQIIHSFTICPSYSSIIHANLFHQIQGGFYWHTRKAISYNLVPSKRKANLCGPSGRWITKCWQVNIWLNSAVLLICNIYDIHNFFYKKHFFSIQPQCCLNFSWIVLQVLLRCYLLHISITILRHLIFTIIVTLSRPRSTQRYYYFSFSFSLWSIV